jgi:hypothetical protein
MYDYHQQLLCEILGQCGTHLCQHRKCFAVLLYDNCRKEADKRDVLLSVLNTGIVSVLLTPPHSLFQKILLARRLTNRLHNEVGVNKKLARWAIQTWEVALRGQPVQGTSDAQFYLGWLYHLGEDVEQDFQQAAAWYRRATHRGHSLAQYNLDSFYSPRKIIRHLLSQYGTLLCHSPDAFEVLLQENCPFHLQREVLIKALQLGLVTELLSLPPTLSQQALFVSLIQRLEETGIKRMLADWAIQSWYVALLGQPEGGDGESQFALGTWYYQGEKVGQDFQQAAKWYERAATQGHPLAQCVLGTMYAHGRGIKQDYQAAEQWYRQAVAQGVAAAQNNLGILYFHGHGVTQDYQVAVTWFQLAADQGDVIAQYNLGVMYANGRGVSQDYDVAVKWLRLAAASGDGSAREALEVLGRG